MVAAPSLLARSVLAIALTLGFYGIAIGVACVLLYLPWAEAEYGHRIHLKVVIGCVLSAGTILWSLVPRRTTFTPPGPRLDPTTQPRLFGEIERIARHASQQMPSDVFLVGDANAWVSEVGGVAGVGRRRVMGIGLPLLAALRVRELRAVIAHEFGHYHGGDTKLGPWIHGTRSAIGRTVQSLEQRRSVLRFLFRAYANLFLWLTHAVSRAQELAADRLAATIAGRDAAMDGLRAVHRVAAVYDVYWRSEVAPILQSGHRPPIAVGFAGFLCSPAMEGLLGREEQAALDQPSASAHDTHPTLRQRLEALGKLPRGGDRRDEADALSLLDGIDSVEGALLVAAFGNDSERFAAISWDAAGEAVYRPLYESAVSRASASLEMFTFGDLPAMMPRFVVVEGQLRVQAATAEIDPNARSAAIWLVGAAMATALSRRGYQVVSAPGEPVRLERGRDAIDPFAVVSELAAGKVAPPGWSSIVAEVGPYEPLSR